MKNEPIVIERVFNAPVERVWKAITNADDMKQWYFDIPGFKPEVDFEFTFNGENEGRVFVHLCKVTEVVPNHKLTHTWRYEGYEGNSFVTFELIAGGEQTRLKLTHEGLETFPPVSDFARSNFEAGWTYIIGTSIKNFLESETTTDI